MKKTAFSKPGSFSSAKRTASSAAPSSGNRLWEKKPSQGFKKFGHGKPGQSEDGKPSGDKRPYQLNMKKRKADTDAEATPDAKKARKQLTAAQIKERKMMKPNAPLVAEVLRLWGLFSQKSTEKEEKHRLIGELLKLAKGKIPEIVFRGSASRVFQSVLKEGLSEHRALVFAELKDHVIDMAKNAYAHRLLMRMLHYGTLEQTDVLIKAFYGNVCNLMRQRDASRVLEYIYSTEEIGRPLQKLALVEEFFGVEFETIKPTSKRTLDDILRKNPEKKMPILNHLRGKLMPIINKADMSTLLNHTLLHVPLLGLFNHQSTAENEAMIDALKDNLVRIVHSKEGAKVAAHCLAYGSPKVRKSIIKAMKGYVVKIAMEQHGHVVLLRLFDVLDDTVLVAKSIINELKPHLLQLSEDRFGRLVLLHLLTPKNKRYFPTETLDILVPAFLPEVIKPAKDEKDADGSDSEEDDPKKPKKIQAPILTGKMIPTSRKEPEIRQTELYNAIIPELREMAYTQAFRMLSHIYARDVFFEIIITSTAVVDGEEKQKLYNTILSLIGDPEENKKNQMEEDEVSKAFHALDFLREKPVQPEDLMTHSLIHRMLRRFIDEEPGFDVLLLEKIGDRVWEYTEKTYSSWVIYSLLQSSNTSAKVRDQRPNKITNLCTSFFSLRLGILQRAI
jgi:pumilio family protein 6